MKVSFDFDDTLSHIKIQEFAKELVLKDIDVYIITSREDPVVKAFSPDWNKDLFEVANWCGIPFGNIHFLNLGHKYTFFNNLQILAEEYDDQFYEPFGFHLDDCKTTCEEINCLDLVTKAICWKEDDNWIDVCRSIIKEELKKERWQYED